MQLIIKIRQGELIPAWYGIAYYSFHEDCAYATFIPFNIIYAIVRSIYIFMRVGGVSVRQNSRESYWQGLLKGKNDKG
jgi:hypothetical protein